MKKDTTNSTQQLSNDSLRIAVVDDNHTAVTNLRDAIRNAGFIPVPVLIDREARTIEEVLEKIAGVPIVLLDNEMGKFSGKDVFAQMPKDVFVVSTSSGEQSYCTRMGFSYEKCVWPADSKYARAMTAAALLIKKWVDEYQKQNSGNSTP